MPDSSGIAPTTTPRSRGCRSVSWAGGAGHIPCSPVTSTGGPVGEVYGSRRRRGHAGRRLLITLIVLLIIIVGALAVLDRLGASYAERVISDRVAEQVANQKATSEKPDVTIEGVPFLTQVVKGRYQEIKIEL